MMNPQQTFAARLQRIASHAGNTNATLHIGMDDQLPQAALLRHALVGQGKLPRQGSMLINAPVALLSGIAAWLWAKWTLPVLLGDTVFWLVLVAAGAAVLLLRLVAGLRGRLTLALQIIGLAVAILGLPNAVHLWPEVFAAVYSAEWVTTVQAHSQPLALSLGAITL